MDKLRVKGSGIELTLGAKPKTQTDFKRASSTFCMLQTGIQKELKSEKNFENTFDPRALDVEHHAHCIQYKITHMRVAGEGIQPPFANK